MFELAHAYRTEGMAAYCRVQETEFALEELAGYRGVKHQRFVGTGYFDQVAQVIASGHASTTALAGSTEAAQFTGEQPHCPGMQPQPLIVCNPPVAAQPPRSKEE
jgi:isocitrate lyase